MGDASFAEQASAKIQELMAEVKAVIVVLHNVGLLKRVCTKALWLRERKVRSKEDPETVFAQYQQAVWKTLRQ